MCMRIDPDYAAIFIADLAQQFAAMADKNGHSALACVLRMAEMEARLAVIERKPQARAA